MTDDRTLLCRYAATRDEAAFAEVVRRHLTFVYSTALRRLGRDAHHAQDVTQMVFCALARDARRVTRYPVLGGWLYTATRNAVINVVRGEQRRRTREEEAGHMQLIDSDPGASADWSKLRPVLDAALDQLAARDREAVLLRFFQGCSFGEIGAIVGVSEEAARKRLDRALAKLRDLLRPYGVASTSAALAALLAGQPISAAPAGLLASVTGAALSTGGAVGAGVVTFFTMTKLQAGIAAAAFLAAALGLITQQRTISALRASAAATEHRLAPLPPGSSTAGKTRGALGAESAILPAGALAADSVRPPTVPGEVLAGTTAALLHGKVPERYYAFMGVLQKLNRDNWREVLRGFDDEQKRTGLAHPEVWQIFVRRAGEVAGADAVDYFFKSAWPGDAQEAMMGWASRNPAEALQWLGRDADLQTRRSLTGAAIHGLALTEPDLAVKTLEEQPAKYRNQYANELITSSLRAVGMDGARSLVEGMIARATESGDLKADYLKHVFSDYTQLRTAQAKANGTLPEALDWLNQYVGQPYVDHRLIATIADRLARDNPAEALSWLEGVNTTMLQSGDPSPAGYRAVLDRWKTQQGAQVVETWLQGQTSHPHYDQMASQYAALVVDQDANKALKWVNTIKNPAIKQNAMQMISQHKPAGKS